MREIITISPSESVLMMHRAGVRPSVQRLAILRNVAEGQKHPTADDIYRDLRAEYPLLSRTTVYNSLRVLTKAGLLRELELESGNRRYDFAPQPRHGHLRCDCCGRIFDMELPEELQFPVPAGFSIGSFDVFFRGLCPDCSGKSENK